MSFSTNYITARKKFIDAASKLNYQLQSYSLGEIGASGEDLTIDVAINGVDNAEKVLVISSGLHGVEGFLGSAIQVALLEKDLSQNYLKENTKIVLIHGLNPYGFSWRRRANENNIDLNRNFLLPGETYQGSPEKYGELNNFLNPQQQPSKFEPFLLQVIALIITQGMTTLKNTIAGGQYDFPQGLFFGGNKAAKTVEILEENLAKWIRAAKQVVHLDFHTGGIKEKGEYKLLIEENHQSELFQKLTGKFNNLCTIEADGSEGIGYTVKGSLNTWCKAKFPDINYIVLTPEFGTNSSIRVLQALRAENFAHLYLKKEDNWYQQAKNNLVEAFAPSDANWRKLAISQGLDIVQEARKFLSI